MEEDLIDAATVFELNHTDSIYKIKSWKKTYYP
jgi:hypothetical protein